MNEKEIYSDKVFWDDYWQEENRKEDQFIFSKILDRHVTWNNIRTYMEIGGAPGSIMSFMYKKHNLEVSTIDFCDRKIIDDFLSTSGLENYNVYSEDFCKFDVEGHGQKYDIVSSWGVIEHFSLENAAKIIEKKKQLVKKGGYLVVELPNIRFFNWLLYYVFDHDLLKIHNLKTMNISFLRNEIQKDGFDILYGDYYLSSFFQYNDSNAFFDKHRIIGGLFRFISKMARNFGVDNIPNRFFSPYIVFIAKKHE